MRIDGILLDNVDINKIIPIYIENVSESKQKKLLRILDNRQLLSSHIIIEKDKLEDKYWLVAGFPEYSAYLKMHERNIRIKQVPCVIQPYSNETEQRIILLKRIFHHQTTKWLDKHTLINQLLDEGHNAPYIANKIGINASDIESYIIHPGIPPQIIERAKKNQGSFINLEKIRKLKLDSLIEYKLFQRAVLKIRHPDRLTTDKLDKIKWLIKREKFADLGLEDKWEMIQHAMEYKDTLEGIWDLEIKRKLRRNKSDELTMRIRYIPNSASYKSNYQDYAQ
jgi:hypothetical protein